MCGPAAISKKNKNKIVFTHLLENICNYVSVYMYMCITNWRHLIMHDMATTESWCSCVWAGLDTSEAFSASVPQ